MSGLIERASRRPATAHVRHVQAVPPGAATGLVAQVYRQVERDFGMLAPPVSLHSPAPGALAAAWLMLREALLAQGAATREAKEAVAAAVSVANRCPYCVEVHGATLRGLLRGESAAAVAEQRWDDVSDPRLREIALWAGASGLGTPVAPGGEPAPLRADEAPELIGVAVTFHYVNRMVNVFLVESLLPAGIPGPALPGVRRMAAWLMGSLARRTVEPGDSLQLLPAAPPPADLHWAAGNPNVSDAFARAYAAIEAGAEPVPDEVRALILERLADPTAEPPGLSARAWADKAVAGLPEAHRPAARLGLVTAFSSAQVGPDLVDAFRRVHPGEDTLIEFTSWASLAAARQISTQLAPAGTTPPPAVRHLEA
ncbi:carboxymuconolactone decarboxylase family protein [Micromonospora sp. NPDC049523]|uniref:carboxymuconolactone decarboxylase family protein n=1 Tax=Micromonospora sp. NPDC049523 TaxID=3155921 RepID=UPI00342F93EE